MGYRFIIFSKIGQEVQAILSLFRAILFMKKDDLLQQKLKHFISPGEYLSQDS